MQNNLGMEYIDTHSHLFADEFADDRYSVIDNAIKAGVRTMLLPNIDRDTLSGLLDVCQAYPKNCFPMIGLHPTSVKDDYRDQLKTLRSQLDHHKFVAIGEIGIDLYWDKTHLMEQQDAFIQQIDLARASQLPMVIHSRESFSEIMTILKQHQGNELYQGVFHCFTGTVAEAMDVISMGFRIGIGGVVTFKNTTLHEVVRAIPLENFILETDSPYLAPMPHRGKRNESAYIPYIAEKIAALKNIGLETVAFTTTQTAKTLFNLN